MDIKKGKMILVHNILTKSNYDFKLWCHIVIYCKESQMQITIWSKFHTKR